MQGSNFSGTLATFTDLNGDLPTSSYPVSIDWGDDSGADLTGVVADLGGGNYVVTGSHTYDISGDLTPIITIAEPGGATTMVVDDAEVNGVDLTAQTVTETQGADDNQVVATFVDDASDAPADYTGYTATIAWGDAANTTTACTIAAAVDAVYSVYATPPYTTAGTFYPTVTVMVTMPADGRTATATGEADIAGITGVGQTITAMNGASLGGEVVDFTDTGSGAPLTPYTASVQWVSGGATTSGTVTPDGNGGYTVSVSGVTNPYSGEGVYSPTVTISAYDGRSSVISFTVDITTVAVTTDTVSGTAGQTYTGTVATFTDSTSGTTAGSYTATIYWGDGNSSTGVVTANGTLGFLVTGTDTLAQNGPLSPQVFIADETGAMASAGTTVAEIGGGTTATENLPYALYLMAGETGTNQATSWTINWGDGNIYPYNDFQTVDGDLTSASHIFASGVSAATISATLTDPTGTYTASESISVDVTPAAPTNVAAVWNADGTATVTWSSDSPLSSNVGVSYSTDGGNSFSSPITVSAAAGTYIFSNLAEWQTYIFSVSVTSSQSATNSSEVELDPPALNTPSTPTYTINEDGSVTLTWTDPLDGRTGFQVEEKDYQNTGTGFYWIADVPLNQYTYTIYGLTMGDEYGFRVRAVNLGDDDYSSEVDVTIPTTGLAGVPVASLSGTTLSWNDVGASSYVVLYQEESNTLSGNTGWQPYNAGSWTSATSYNVGALTAGQKLEFEVVAQNSVGGVLEPSSPSAASTDDDSSASGQGTPAGFVAQWSTNDPGDIDVGLGTDATEDPSGDIRITIVQNGVVVDSAGGEVIRAGSLDDGWTEYIQPGEPVGELVDINDTLPVTIEVNEFNTIDGIVYMSAPISVTLPPLGPPVNVPPTESVEGPPATPIEVSASIVGKTVHLRWAEPSGNATSYIIYRSQFDDFSKASPDPSGIFSGTTYVESFPPQSRATFWYWVEAVNSRAPAGSQDSSPSAPPVSVSPVGNRGGQIVTSDLTNIANHFEFIWSHVPPRTQVKLANAAADLFGGIGDWDMKGFNSGGFGDPAGTGAGVRTVTVAGGVFDESAVNYWLAGLIYNAIQEISPDDAKLFELFVFGYAYGVAQELNSIINSPVTDSPSEKVEWFEAGVADDPSLPQTPEWLVGVAPGPPGKAMIHWNWGNISGVD